MIVLLYLLVVCNRIHKVVEGTPKMHYYCFSFFFCVCCSVPSLAVIFGYEEVNFIANTAKEEHIFMRKKGRLID